MIENRQKAIKLLWKLEGFSSNLPDDDPTILGVNSRFHPDTYNELKAHSSDPEACFKIAEIFYFKNFWLRYNCDALPDKIDILYFVTAVNTPRGEKMMALSIDNFENECLDAILYYSQTKNTDNRKLGLINRVLRVWQALNEGNVTI